MEERQQKSKMSGNGKKCLGCPYQGENRCGFRGQNSPDANCFRYKNACNKTTTVVLDRDRLSLAVRRCKLPNGHRGNHHAEYPVWNGLKEFEWENENEKPPKEAPKEEAK